MNQPQDSPVPHFLDVMERTHRRIFAVGWVAVAGTLGSYLWLAQIAKTSPSVQRLVMAAVLALTFLIAWSTFSLAVLMLRMGRRILRAIELTANPSEPAR